jgi:flagellar biosynthesis component FlhA
MKKLVLIIFSLAFALQVMASDESKEEPVQHLKIADVTSMKDAEKIFIEKTSEIKSKKKLDQVELQQIHIITYSLEKSVAYFVENLKGERQELAKEIAVIVEDIHISSENSRKEMTETHLNKYFDLAEKFISGF